jgi:hypothetical protein
MQNMQRCRESRSKKARALREEGDEKAELGREQMKQRIPRT